METLGQASQSPPPATSKTTDHHCCCCYRSRGVGPGVLRGGVMGQEAEQPLNAAAVALAWLVSVTVGSSLRLRWGGVPLP